MVDKQRQAVPVVTQADQRLATHRMQLRIAQLLLTSLGELLHLRTQDLVALLELLGWCFQTQVVEMEQLIDPVEP